MILKPWFPLFFLALALAFCGACATSKPGSGESKWVYPGPGGKLAYKTTPRGDRIMDFSTAGYMGGGVALPNFPVVKTIQPDNAADDTAMIQAAIDEVSALPLTNGVRGALVLAPGNYICSNALVIAASGVVLRGSGTNESTIQMAGGRHVALRVGMGGRRNRERGENQNEDTPSTNAVGLAKTFIADRYVPSGTTTFRVADAKGFTVGDVIELRHPVTAAWVKFMNMDNLTRNGRPQTWIRTNTVIPIERRIAAIAGNKITLDVPLSDSFDARYLNPPGTVVAKIKPPERLTQVGIENLHIESPLQRVNHTQELYTAVRLNGEDCWMRDVRIDETMNSVSLGGRRITLENVSVNRKALHLGASKPAEFAPNGDQILLDRCSVNADNVWFAATGAGHSGPIVFLNCTFKGNGHIEGHMRWTTGMLLDSCEMLDGGIDFKNRGAMGSGHGWGAGWSVAWNCFAKSFVVQQPPGAYNWAIGCIGDSVKMSRPFDSKPMLPEGTFDSHGRQVKPESLYLAQLQERLGLQALRNIGYVSPNYRSEGPPVIEPFFWSTTNFVGQSLQSNRKSHVNEGLGEDLAFQQPVSASNVKDDRTEFAGDMAVDGDGKTYWTTTNGTTHATLELDMDGPTEINSSTIEEAAGMTGRIREYKVEGQVNSDWKLLAQGATVGDRQVDRFPRVTVWKVRLTIVKATDAPAIREFGLYLNEGDGSK